MLKFTAELAALPAFTPYAAAPPCLCPVPLPLRDAGLRRRRNAKGRDRVALRRKEAYGVRGKYGKQGQQQN